MRIVVLLTAPLLALVVACSGGDDEDKTAGDGEAGSETEAAAEVATEPTTEPTADATADSSEDDSAGATMYIGGTGGSGVALRDACRDDART